MNIKIYSIPNLEIKMYSIDFLWTSDKEYSSLLPVYEYMKKSDSSIKVNFFKVKKFFFQNQKIKRTLSKTIVISHDRPLKRLKKINWEGEYIYIEHGLSPMKYWTYKYNFFHESCLLFYPGKVFERKMKSINPNFKNGLLGGYPKVDELVNQKIDKINFCKKNNLNPNKPIILFAPSYGAKESKKAGLNNVKYFKNIKNLIIIPHPAEYKYAKKFDARIPEIKANINSYINIADVIISDVSSIIVEAAIVNKPVIQLILSQYPGCFPEKDKRPNEDSYIKNDRIQNEINKTDLKNRPFKIPYIDEDWILGHTCYPEEIEQTINQVLKNKDQYINQRYYWANQCAWKIDGKNCNRIAKMISQYIKTGERIQVE